MTKRVKVGTRVDILQGTLDLLILQALQWGPQHGYGISQAIQSSSGDALVVDTGSLYPALHRLERQHWVTSAWKTSTSNQRVREYRITTKGKRQLLSERSRWEQWLVAMTGVLNRSTRP